MLNENLKTCVITGVTSGIGEQCALILASKGFEIIGIGRSEKRCLNTQNKITKISNNQSFIINKCDLSDHKQIKELSKKISSQTKKIDLLINNAGGIFLNRELDNQNIEMTFSVNYLSHFLLTGLLLETILSTKNSQIINVSSIAHEKSEINFDDISYKNGFNGMKVYGQSKLAILMWTYALSNKLISNNTIVNAVHPGIIGTRLLSNNGLISPILNLGLKIVGKNSRIGAENIVNAYDNAQHNNSGNYYHEKNISISSKFSRDKKNQEQLWTLSENMLNFRYPKI